MRHRIIRPLLAWMTAATLASFNPEENNGTPDPIWRKDCEGPGRHLNR
jgi:hypothetical protein